MYKLLAVESNSIFYCVCVRVSLSVFNGNLHYPNAIYPQIYKPSIAAHFGKPNLSHIFRLNSKSQANTILNRRVWQREMQFFSICIAIYGGGRIAVWSYQHGTVSILLACAHTHTHHPHVPEPKCAEAHYGRHSIDACDIHRLAHSEWSPTSFRRWSEPHGRAANDTAATAAPRRLPIQHVQAEMKHEQMYDRIGDHKLAFCIALCPCRKWNLDLYANCGQMFVSFALSPVPVTNT